ncbi:CAF1 family ribonuclease, putative [Talaromyces stipitatus ATCC 10500]|uniref:CAF1 family ribonuclease, putative n=1 Tax=Talaromyces stipitatus (strain ATCC 10500 / CBS 375.48 / QM 6759 / NRRL 1006) TaxID=441959 RepID=B8LYA1_TALSN|nr:CAF1 family ribonuclease, putative [Talaromyces stipitatus ATCC 10500]EED22830.1 CAF1 family ribonuclease, putative [Talaromyces stipitatus ATCC 10500]
MDFQEDIVIGEDWGFRLPGILRDISECAFVALDFEFSGIPSHQAGSRPQSLQERYAEVKEAAKTYQILQVGLTIVKEDVLREKGKYTVKPFNIPLSPWIDPSLHVDRTFGLSSNAIHFLAKIGFNLGETCENGVPYLSKKEVDEILDEARRFHGSRWQTAKRAQIILSDDDIESAAFLAGIRKDIEEWLNADWDKPDYLHVPALNGHAFTRFEKRLIHQLVETEYPSLTSIRSGESIKIVKYDEAKEHKKYEGKMSRVQQRLIDHRGFAWVIEALAGGDLSQMTSQMFEPLVIGEGPDAEYHKTQIITKLKARNGQIAIVGHNLFMDVTYLWQCFYGDLPDRVEDFAQLLHEKFPMLIDTKYIFTHDCGDMNPAATLEKIAEACKRIAKPQIKLVMDNLHTRYRKKACPHEAGYDSLLTAQVFIKQAVQLPGARTRSILQPTQATRKGNPTVQHTSGVALDISKETSTNDQGGHKQKFGTNFSVFETTELENSIDKLAIPDGGHELIPPFSSPVWKVYGNKLRVFGTHERVFELGD